MVEILLHLVLVPVVRFFSGFVLKLCARNCEKVLQFSELGFVVFV